MRRGGFTLAVVTIALVAGFLWATDASATGGSITGHVTVEGQPIADTLLKIYEGAATTATAATKTDSQGNFTFAGLDPGSYVVTVFGTTTHESQWWDHAATRETATPIDVGDGSTITGVDFELGPPPPPSGPITIVSVRPVKLKHGTRTEVAIKGSGLSPMSSATMSGDGVKRIVIKEGSTDVRLRVAISLTAKASRGQRSLTLIRLDGASVTIPITIV
jgi:hypothetical protein